MSSLPILLYIAFMTCVMSLNTTLYRDKQEDYKQELQGIKEDTLALISEMKQELKRGE